jgi:hypothetical protein
MYKKIMLIMVFINFAFVTKVASQEIKFSDLGTASRGEFTSYISKDGAIYKIGDRLKIGVPSSNKTFAFISEGDGLLTPITPLLVGASGQETEIKRIFVIGNKRAGYSVAFRSKGISGFSNYTIQIENAIENKEVKSFGMSSDEALAELKKDKDKLDLGIITKEEFEQKKLELTKFIK